VVMQQAGLAGGKGGALGMDRPTYCNFNVPHPQPLAPKDAPMAERLFIVSQPDPIPENCLCDLFCRFGNLIDAYFLPGISLLMFSFGFRNRLFCSCNNCVSLSVTCCML
jgi:hypothetical protein